MEEAWNSAGAVEDVPEDELEEQEEDEEEDDQSDEEDDDDGDGEENEKGNTEKDKKVKKRKQPRKKFNLEEDEKIISKIVENSMVKLSDGSKAPMFSRGPLYLNGSWPANCHLCRLHGFRSPKSLNNHIRNNRKHQRHLKEMPIDAAKFKEPLYQQFSRGNYALTNLIIIYPGEKITRITPELEGRILQVPEKTFTSHPPKDGELYKTLYNAESFHTYNKKAPVVGLSYCFYLDTFKSIGYYCALCLQYSVGSAYHHFLGKAHCLKYGRKHFPRLIRKISESLSDMKDEKAKEKIICEVIHKIYRSIELTRGFRVVQISQLDTFALKCAKFCNRILHYGDNHVLTTDEELKEMVEKCRRGEHLLEPVPSSLMDAPKNTKADTELNAKARAELLKDSLPMEKSKKGKKKKKPEFVDNKANWNLYRKMLGNALDDMDDRYADYEKIPEKHPAYEHEWKKFWTRRTDEILKDGLNPDDYDFKTEWIPYWKKTMQKYHKTSISKSKLNIKKSLRLPLHKRSPSPIRKQQPLRRKRSPSPVKPARRRRTRSPSPAYRARRRESPPAIAKTSEPPGVITVLRLLTAFEDKLGSLGPKALEYLSKSVLYEKQDDENNANQLLLKQEYYVFFATAKEKLKGQLIAGLVEQPKYKAVSHVIKEIDTLIEMFDDYCKRTGKTVTAEPQNDRPQTSKQQTSRFNEDDQYEDRSQDNYNRSRQDFNKSCNDDYNYGQYQEDGGQMNQYRGSGGNNNQYGRPQNQYDTASSNQYNDDASNSNQYGQNRSMSSNSNQGSSSNQYSRSNQGGGVWQSGTNMTFRNNANNPQGSGGGYYGSTGNQGSRGIQNFRSDRDENLSTSYADRGGNYNSNPDGNFSGNYNSDLANRSARNYNNSSLGRNGNFNTPQGDTGYNQGNYSRDSYNDSQNRNDNNQQNQGYGSGTNYKSAYTSGNKGSFNSGFGGNNQGRNMAPPDVVMNKSLGNYGGYNSSNMNTRRYGGGNQYN